MPTPQPVTVTLDAPDGPSSTAAGTLRHFTAGQRVLRAAATLLVGIAVAALLIPIPIIHLVGIPLALVLAVFFAGRQLLTSVRLAPLRLPCPKCGAENRVGGGLGYRSATAPIEHTCDSCRRQLTLRIQAN
ncbi:MAG: hypothetical protein IPJ11_01525 [Gemmatimonadetes bacterium]|nr:hypothetical protein [Gemmatimonadota bacterium]